MRCPASDRWRRGGVRWSLRVILRRAAIRALERSVPARSATRRSLGVSASTPVRVPRPGRAPERRPRVRDRPRRSSQAGGRDTAERTRASPSTRAALAKRHNDGGAQADPLSETGAQERAAVLGREEQQLDRGRRARRPGRPSRRPDATEADAAAASASTRLTTQTAVNPRLPERRQRAVCPELWFPRGAGR